MARIEKLMFTGRARTTPSVGEVAPSSGHGRLDIETSATGSGTRQEQAFNDVLPHPTAEQLFAGAWSACYITALLVTSQQMKLKLPRDVAVEIDIDLGQSGSDFFIEARFNVVLPGMDREQAEALVHKAHELCPYSKATKGNIHLSVNVSVPEIAVAV